MNWPPFIMLLVSASDTWVRVECGSCGIHHVLPGSLYRERMANGRLLECKACMALGRLPDRRHNAARVVVDRRRTPQYQQV
jgi:hypothetical protein